MFQLYVRRLALTVLLCTALTAASQGDAQELKRTVATKPGAATHVKSKHSDTSKEKVSTPEVSPASNDETGSGHKPAGKDQTAYAFGLPTADGKNLPLSEYKGKVLLVVNLGRQSSYAAQLPALEKLSATFKEKGLVVLGIPSNDFGNAEPGTPAEVARYYADAKVPFPVMQVSSLTGVHELPLFGYLSRNKAVENNGLHWNYTKYLIDRSGKVVVCLAPETAPDSLEMMATVQGVLDGTWKPKKPETKGKGAEIEDEEE